MYEGTVNLSYIAFMAPELGSFSHAEDAEQTEVEAFTHLRVKKGTKRYKSCQGKLYPCERRRQNPSE